MEGQTSPSPSPSMERLVRANRRAILDLARKHGASEVMVFGSVARGDAGESSDVDFLVTFGPRGACSTTSRSSRISKTS